MYRECPDPNPNSGMNLDELWIDHTYEAAEDRGNVREQKSWRVESFVVRYSYPKS